MKALWIVMLGIALGGCAVPSAQYMSVATGPLVETSISGFIPVSSERPQEIVGTENHRAVLDGAS